MPSAAQLLPTDLCVLLAAEILLRHLAWNTHTSTLKSRSAFSNSRRVGEVGWEGTALHLPNLLLALLKP